MSDFNTREANNLRSRFRATDPRMLTGLSLDRNYYGFTDVNNVSLAFVSVHRDPEQQDGYLIHYKRGETRQSSNRHLRDFHDYLERRIFLLVNDIVIPKSVFL